jgi:hypothetical protein
VKNTTLFKVVYYPNYSFVGYFNVTLDATKGMLGTAQVVRNTTPLAESNYAAVGDGFITATFHCPE